MSPLYFLSAFCIYYFVSHASWTAIIIAFGAIFVPYVLLSIVYPSPPMTTRRKLMMATWSPPSEGTVFGLLTCNAEPLQRWRAEQKEKSGVDISVTTAVVRALGLALRVAPGLNTTIAFGKFLQKKTIDVSCLVALEDGKDLASAKITSVDQKSPATIQQDLKAKADKLRARKDADFEASKPLLKLLPVFLIEPMVEVVGYLSGALGIEIGFVGVRPFPFGSAMVTSVGMLGVEQAFVPFTPFSRIPLLVMVGAITKKPIVEDDKIIIQEQLTLTATLDHRFADGTEVAKLGKKIKEILENPTLLDQ